MAEETGFAASRIKKMGDIFPVPGYSNEKIAVYKAWGLKRRKADLDKDEILTQRAVTKRQVQKLFTRGALKDAKTVCALSLCGWLC